MDKYIYVYTYILLKKLHIIYIYICISKEMNTSRITDKFSKIDIRKQKRRNSLIPQHLTNNKSVLVMGIWDED